MKMSHDYLKPAIAAKMPQAENWYNESSKEQILDWCADNCLAVADDSNKLVSNWAEIATEAYARKLASS